ncbi:MAG: hypothetical protein HY905_02470 [Deltaproteobacteria bacterium]|nr:hypothetical protein [Deltaproteobacteria bacterium]
MDPYRRCALALAATLAAGSDCSQLDEDPGGTCTTTEFSVSVDVLPAPRLDMLVVLDDSPSMDGERQAFLEQFPEVLRDLLVESDPDGDTCPEHVVLDDLHLAVVTPNLGSDGLGLPGCNDDVGGDEACFRLAPAPAAPDCPAALPPFLALDRSELETYPPERLIADFTCLAAAGAAGCGIEQPLAAALRALTVQAGDEGCNRGFRRPEVPLALIFVTDEDDGSLDPAHPELLAPDRSDLGPLPLRSALHPELLRDMAELADGFEALALPDPARLMVGLIVGVPYDSPVCTGSGDHLYACLGASEMTVQVDPTRPQTIIPACNSVAGRAEPARRFVDLAQRLSSSARVTSICAPDSWEPMLLDLLSPLFVHTLPSDCFPRQLPFDPDTCRTSCVLVETLADDRPCPRTPDCPPSWCPPANAGAAAAPPPCVDPVTGRACTPHKRDLGTVHLPDGSSHRQCLLRQADRPATDGACGPPVADGWYYLPPDLAPNHCPRLVLDSSVPLGCCDHRGSVEPGSDVELLCWKTACADRFCGPPASPSELQCAGDQYCATPGECRPAWD